MHYKLAINDSSQSKNIEDLFCQRIITSQCKGYFYDSFMFYHFHLSLSQQDIASDALKNKHPICLRMGADG